MRHAGAAAAVLVLLVALTGCDRSSAPVSTRVEMALVPAGDFLMGDCFAEGERDELPVHAVYVSAFYMDTREVTKVLWDEVARWATAHGYDIKPSDGGGKAADHPVWGITWDAAVKWANARSEREGLTPCYTVGGSTYRAGEQMHPDCNWDADGYRLPTEAEWEKAARGGAGVHRFPWVDTDTIQHSRANYCSASFGGEYRPYDTSPTRGYHPMYATGEYPYTSSRGKATPNTSPVGSFAPNGYGLYDMAGNVQEWCWDLYCEMMRPDQPTYYESSPRSDPRGTDMACWSYPWRVVRGGSWGDASSCRVADREGIAPFERHSDLGFRLARNAPAS